MPKIKKLIAIIILGFTLVLGGSLFFNEELCDLKYFLWSRFSSEYQQHKSIIEPYFDEQFYLKTYGDAVKKSGLKPIDHFLQRGWHSCNWRNHTDPNCWFNVTLYKERLWKRGKQRGIINLFKIDTNPFVDFLKQPSINDHAKIVDIYAKPDELLRAWLAVEGFLRLNKFGVTLHLTEGLSAPALVRFQPQIKRGLKITYDNSSNLSFYQSAFVKSPSSYNLTDLAAHSQIIGNAPITHIKNDHEYLMHRLYNYTNWYEVGELNPMMINIAHYCDEPMVFARFGNKTLLLQKFIKNILTVSWKDKWVYPRFTPQDFKDYMVRIADGFDLCLLSAKLPINNLKVIPGYLYSCINESELEPIKKFEVSYLLSLGGANLQSYRDSPELNYNLRKDIWNHEKDFKIPTKFYLSFRDKAKFPKDLQNRAMPTDSKKWVFNSQFSIAIENSTEEDWFSEKLLGCFEALTVPIYIGCPNILDYFDPRGMIIVKSLKELMEVTNSLTPETYQRMLPYLKENRKRALKILSLEKEVIAEFFKRLDLQ